MAGWRTKSQSSAAIELFFVDRRASSLQRLEAAVSGDSAARGELGAG